MQFFCWWKEHIGRFISAEAACSDIERAVGPRYIVRRAESEKLRDAIDGRRAAFEFQERADGGLIELNFQVPDTWMDVGRPEFFISERWTESQGGQNLANLISVGDGYFYLFSDLVTALVSRAIV